MRVRERRRPEGQAGAWTERRDVGSWRGMARWQDGKMGSGGRVGEAGWARRGEARVERRGDHRRCCEAGAGVNNLENNIYQRSVAKNPNLAS